jgi:homopolymeric O-antigen transport system ATP-binding protein
MKPILEVQHIGKQFYIGGKQERYLSLRDVVANPFKKLKQPKAESFWALEDINFDIMPGESIGIIGRNGAGKSTLLKILSKITPPTRGKVICRGRVASLLEVGTGFHPELTGRENVYMNGSILGMRKWEIDKHFDAIVDFSGVEQFLDTPLKRYSSGMQLRLAFAVAAHLEPEILVIDEVLAVGDAEFQKKCLGKMGEVSKSGRTILFVSHNMGAVSALCSKAILLSKGNVECFDTTGDVIAKYFSNSSNSSAHFDLTDTKAKYADTIVELVSGSVTDNNNEIKPRCFIDEEIRVNMRYRIKKEIDASIVPNFHFFNGNGECIFVINAQKVTTFQPGLYEATCIIPPNFLNDGVHFVLLASTTYYQSSFDVNFMYKDALSFEIVDKLHDNPFRYNYTGPLPGVIRPALNFEVKAVGE